jgi:hypothetical protein
MSYNEILPNLLFWKREEKRWKESCDLGFRDVTQELYQEQLPARDFCRKRQKLETVFANAIDGIEFLTRVAPTLFEDLNGRVRWNRYLTGVNCELSDFRWSFFLKGIFFLLKLQGAADIIESYVVRLAQAVKVFHTMFQPADEYVKNWFEGENIMREYGQTPHEELVALFTHCKTFPEDARFETFHDSLNRTCNEAITVIIEDSVTLFLKITRDFIEIFVRLPLLRQMEHFEDKDVDRKLVEEDMKIMILRLAGYIEDSEHRALLNRLLRKAAAHAVDSWYEEEKQRRRQFSSLEKRQRFVEQFKQGLILV